MSLAEPSFIARDANDVTAELVTFYEQITGKTLQPAQPEMLLINLIAYRETLTRIAIQEAAKQNLVSYALSPMLDYLGQFVGVTRLDERAARCRMTATLGTAIDLPTAIPAGVRVACKSGLVFATETAVTIPAGEITATVYASCETVGTVGNGYLAGEVAELLDSFANLASVVNDTVTMGGAAMEDDDHLRERIKLAPEAYSVAGCREAYRFWAMTAHASIIDVAVVSPTPGVITLYPLTTDGTPNQVVLDAVAAVCSADTVRPLTDQVTVADPTRVAYSIDVRLTLYASADQVAVENQARAGLAAYAAAQKEKLGRDVTTSRIVATVGAISGVYRADLVTPTDDVICTETAWADCDQITITTVRLTNG